MNKIIVSGNLASDVRVNKVNETTEVINGTVIVDDSYTQDGQRVERSIPYNFAYFRDLGKAEKLAGFLTKGRNVVVEGSLNKLPASAPAANGKIYHDVQIRVDEIELGRLPHEQEAAARAAKANAA
jgi:single-stranded DNA-binding protein